MSIDGVVQAEYEYNSLGQQVVRRLTQAGQVIHSIHDASGNRIAEYDVDEVAGTSTLLREYIWMDGMPVAVVQGGVVYYIRVDHIGRPAFATDGAANIVWEVNYLPFGGIESSSGTILDLRFPGQWFQLESGLHQNWMRDYDPTTGRYMQADPLGLVDGASVYGYVTQNPMRYTDPTGLIRHVTGRWITCGPNCRIRIDRSYVNGQWARHLHWECRGDVGVCGEDGSRSHGGTWASAPRAVQQCAINNGFRPSGREMIPLSRFIDLGMIFGLLGILLGPEVGVIGGIVIGPTVSP